MPLTDTACRNAKPKDRSFKMADGHGLYLLVTPPGPRAPKGSRLWRLDYRHNGRRQTLALGNYPTVGLGEARERRDAARKLLAQGINPSAQRKADKAVAKESAAHTFRAVGEEWLSKQAANAPSTMGKKRWLLTLADPVIGDIPIANLTAPKILEALRAVEARGRLETARRLRIVIGQVCSYAISVGRAESNPTAPLKGAIATPQVTHRAAITNPDGIGALLRAIDDFQGQPQVHAALRLLPLLFCRPGELRLARWREFDLANAVWTIPAERTKMRRQHQVPLSRQALTILQELRRITGDGDLLFPGIRTVQRPISENTLNAALRRLGYTRDEMTSHGFRAMAATRLNEMCRWHPDVIERQLAHQDGNAVRRAYTHAVEYWPERVEMMQVWSDYLDGLRDARRAA
jgi:integrase